MFDLATALAWGLQGVGAVGAIWGLFSSDTSAKNKRTGKRRLTERGWFAVGGVVSRHHALSDPRACALVT